MGSLPNRTKKIDQEGYKRLTAKLEQCQHELEELDYQLANIGNAKVIKSEENSSFLFLLNQRNAKSIEVANLKTEIFFSVVVETQINDEVIGFGDKVTLEMTSDFGVTTNTLTLVSSSPNVLKGEVSQDSPIGKFVYGKTVGTCGKVFLPDGKSAHVKIISKEK